MGSPLEAAVHFQAHPADKGLVPEVRVSGEPGVGLGREPVAAQEPGGVEAEKGATVWVPQEVLWRLFPRWLLLGDRVDGGGGGWLSRGVVAAGAMLQMRLLLLLLVLLRWLFQWWMLP